MDINRNFDECDALIRLSCDECLDKDVDEFFNAEIVYRMSERANRRILRMIRKESRVIKHPKLRRAVAIAVFAILLAGTLAFVACVSIPRVRRAMWKSIVEWHDDYISIKFVPDDDTDDKNVTDDKNNTGNTDNKDNTDNIGDNNGNTQTEPPKIIEEINLPKYIPDGYSFEKYEGERMISVDYYSDDELMYSFGQFTISSTGHDYVDSEDATVSQIFLNDLNATLITYGGDIPGVYALYWQDGKYLYNIYGIFESYEQLIMIASSVEVLY